MREPQGYFTDPVEREIAIEAWKIGGNTGIDPFFTWFPPHQALTYFAETDFQVRVITARNWITGMRDQELPWGESGIERVTRYFQDQYKKTISVNNTRIANVEHFYPSATLTAVALHDPSLRAAWIAQPLAIHRRLAASLCNPRKSRHCRITAGHTRCSSSQAAQVSATA